MAHPAVARAETLRDVLPRGRGRYVICRSLAEFQHELADYLSTVDPNTLSALAAIHRAVEAAKAEAAKKEYKKLINNGQ